VKVQPIFVRPELDATLAPFAGRALRTYLAAPTGFAFIAACTGNAGLSLRPDRTSLAALASRPLGLLELGGHSVVHLFALLPPHLTERPGDDLHHVLMLGRDLLSDVSFEILTPARHFIIRQIAAVLLLWRVRVRDAALKFSEAALDLGLQRLRASYVACVRRGVPAV
jgi:hypothetical protein